MLTAAQIRQSFLEFFREKKHVIVPSSSLMPDSPNLLFTNAGMNQFVPIFLGERKADVNTWAGAVAGKDALATRAADTQKCIRAGGKHNDLDDVGLDTYHHTFFEMLGNWSFGDYFKKDAIDWAWELVVERWKFPAQRVYATVHCRFMGEPNWQLKWAKELKHAVMAAKTGATIIGRDRDPSAEKGNEIKPADQQAAEYWAEHFLKAGLDPFVHVVPGNNKDNFWMMGETGPCGPCSELHIDLTPAGDTKGALVNKGTAECIEIWNLVFIQFNANPDGTFSPLPAQHVDTGMGFERVTSIIQGTKNFSDFANAKISNYETDIFRPIFDELEKMSGCQYTSTLPSSAQSAIGDRQLAIDVAFRVIADHIRTLSFAIADGIQPGNTDRNYVLRRILRRAVRYGRTLGFHEPFFYKLVAVLARTMGDVFPEVRAQQKHVEHVLKREEEAFNRTLDEGLKVFEDVLRIKRAAVGFRKTLSEMLHVADTVDESPEQHLESAAVNILGAAGRLIMTSLHDLDAQLAARIIQRADIKRLIACAKAIAAAAEAPGTPATPEEQQALTRIAEDFRAALMNFLAMSRSFNTSFNGEAAFLLYDTYGFPLDLTELLARERGLTVDVEGYKACMAVQRKTAQAAQKKQVIELSEVETKEPTTFIGYDELSTPAKVLEVVELKDKTAVILDTTTAYAEMGGQVGDTGEIALGAETWRIANTQKSGQTWLHFLEGVDAPEVGAQVTLGVELLRRRAIERHHSVTHLLHWALHEVVSREATQKGSFVGPDKLTFDFNHAALTPAQVRDIERLVNEKIVENAVVAWSEVPYAEVKGRPDIMQFFGDKYGEIVRVVDIGGYSKELCAGTHTRATGEIGQFRIVSEAAIAAGVRRIEAVAGLNAYDAATTDAHRLHELATKIGAPLSDLEKKLEALLAHEKELEKTLKAAQQREAAGRAKELLASAGSINGTPAIIANLGAADGDTLQTVVDALKAQFKGVIVVGGSANGAVALVAAVTPDFTAKTQAGKIIQAIAPLVGGKGGGKPDNARGGGKDPSQLDAALAHAKTLL